MGLVTETGEIFDAIKKAKIYGKKLDRVNIAEEFGDMFWYLAVGCDSLGITFEEVWDKNIKKLRARFPERYSDDRALNRDLRKERKILEHKKRKRVRVR